jgi:hypothetical protein
MWETKNAQKYLFGKSEGKRPLGTPERGFKDIVKLVLGKKLGGCGLD